MTMPSCCDPGSNYTGKSLSGSHVIMSMSLGGSVDKETYTYTMNGLYSGGTFPVHVSQVSQVSNSPGTSPDWGGCYGIGAHVYTYPTSDWNELMSFSCDPAGFYYPSTYPDSLYTDLHARSLLDNGGEIATCYVDRGDSFLTTRTVTYTSSCFNVSIRDKKCTFYHPSNLVCDSPMELFSWYDIARTFTIA